MGEDDRPGRRRRAARPERAQRPGDDHRRRRLGEDPDRDHDQRDDRPFGPLPGREGFNASASGEDGAPATQAGAHPQQLNVNLGLPTQRPLGFPTPDGTLHDVKTDLPPG